MAEPKRPPLDIPPNPMRTLQGDEPGTAQTRADLKAILLDLLQHDPEVRVLLGTPAAAHLEPDADTAAFIIDLIEQTMFRTLRQDAYRRPK